MLRLLAVFVLGGAPAVGGAGIVQARTRAAIENEVRETRTEDAAEYRVKAAFLYNFIRYTTWPEDGFANADSPLVVVVVGKNPFGKHLQKALDGKRVGGRAIVLRHTPAVSKTEGAHVVFDGGLVAGDRKRLLEQCRGRPVLLVGERPGFAAAGAQCNLYLSKSRVRFEINVDAVRAARLEVSSQLLKLARIVRNEGADR